MAAPGTPTNPTVAPLLGLGTPTKLAWTATNATAYDVYFGTLIPPPLASQGQTGDTYTPLLLDNRTYYWRINAINADGSTQGPIWTFTTQTPTTFLMTLDGATPRTRMANLSIIDRLNDIPNTCTCLVDQTPPSIGQDITIGLGGLLTPYLIFGGTVHAVEQLYDGYAPDTLRPYWKLDCTDYTALLNARRPFGEFTNVSATTVAQTLVASFAPGFTTNNVQASLPNVSVIFDGSQDFSSCLSTLAQQIGGYSYVDYGKDVHLFLEELSIPPDDIDDLHPPLNDPPITYTTDTSQQRTRVYVTGHGEQTLSAVNAADTVIPIANTVMFNQLGGQAITGGQRLTYTGLHAGNGTALIGTTAVPTNPLSVVRAGGTGLTAGVYRWTHTFYDGTGETAPGPVSAPVTIGGTIAAPTSAPSASKQFDGNLSGGTYQWKVTYIGAAGGETTPSAAGSVTLDEIGPTSFPTVVGVSPGGFRESDGGLTANANYSYKQTFFDAQSGRESAPSPASNVVNTGPNSSGASGGTRFEINAGDLQALPNSSWTRRFYRTQGNGSTYLRMTGPANGWGLLSGGIYMDNAQVPGGDATLGGVAPTTGTTRFRQATVTLPVSTDPFVTGRKLYRTTANGSTFKLVATIANNTATSFDDNVADGSLGADAPTSNTTALLRATVSAIAIGPAGTVGRKLYRTVVNGSQQKLLTTIANNTATSFTDSVPDASLGANVPTGNTSGLVVETGEVPAGATSLPVTSIAPYHTGGGWTLTEQMQIRYTGISGSTLTGIPSTGLGSILTTIAYGSPITALPALMGVTGVGQAIPFGAMVYLFVQRDDLEAQAVYGILEYHISDGRIREDTAQRWADADLFRFARPLTTVRYATRDPKTRSGKTVSIDLPSLGLSGDYTIQNVLIDQIDRAPGIWPRFTVEASSTRFSVEDVLRRLLLKAA